MPNPSKADDLRPYLPRLVLHWLVEESDRLAWELDGSVVLVDISGFTRMSERLSRKGKVGAEEITDVLGAVFSRLLSVAYAEGGAFSSSVETPSCSSLPTMSIHFARSGRRRGCGVSSIRSARSIRPPDLCA